MTYYAKNLNITPILIGQYIIAWKWKKNKKFNFQMADQIVMLSFAEYSLQVSLIWLKTVAWTSILW